MMLFVQTGETPSPSKILDQKYSTCQLPFHISEIKCYVLRSLKQPIYLKLDTPVFLWLICGVSTLKCISFGQFTCSVVQVLV